MDTRPLGTQLLFFYIYTSYSITILEVLKNGLDLKQPEFAVFTYIIVSKLFF